MTCTLVRLPLAVILLIALLSLGGAPGLPGPTPAAAQMPGQGEDLYPLGGLGASGRMSDRSFEVREVYPGGPADRAGLRPGDVIVGVAGREIPGGQDPILVLEAAIEEAEAERRANRVPLAVRRGGAVTEVEVEVSRLGAHGRQCPQGCDKCHLLAAAALQWLAAHQAPDGSVPTELGGTNGLVVVSSLAGLAWLAGGMTPSRGAFSQHLGRAVQYVMAHAGEDDDFGMGGAGGNWNQTNWALAYGAYFLSEVYAVTRNPEVGAKVGEFCETLIRNQEASGGWGHGPGGPNALGYVELEIVSNWALSALGAAHRIGLEVPEEPVASALRYVEACAGSDGGVGYSTRSGQQGFGEAGRTSGAIFGYGLLGQERNPFYARMVSYFSSHLDEIPTGHVSPTMHYLTGALAASRISRDVWRAYIDRFRPYWMSMRRPDGVFEARPSEESIALHSNTDREMGEGWTTASVAIILLVPEGNLHIAAGESVGEGAPRQRPSTGH